MFTIIYNFVIVANLCFSFVLSATLRYPVGAPKMRAVRIHMLGSPQVLQIDYNLPLPPAARDEIIVKVKAAGINPVDTYMRQGIYGYDPQVPIILGKEVAGIVERAGPGVEDIRKGDKVICALKHGGYAEYVSCEKKYVLPLPEKFNYSEGAALYVAYFTAYRGLVTKSKIQKGEIALIHGASGSVGIAAVQIAKAHGLTVVGTAGSPEGLALVQKVGADFVVNHRDKNHMQEAMQKAGTKGFDVILENRACINLNLDMKSLKEGGRVAVIGSRDTLEVTPRYLISNEGLVTGVRLNGVTDDQFKEYTKALLKGVEDGWLKPYIGQEYIMEDIPQAHVDIMDEHKAAGKRILLINQNSTKLSGNAKD